jgi:transcriptional regulator with XRE-family HTH domain
MQDLSAFLREFRKRRGLSYAVFSREFFHGALSPQTLKNLEMGQGEPRISTLKVISEKLGVDLRRLVHCTFGLADPEKGGEAEGAVGEISDLAARMSEEERRVLLSFARFVAWEGDAHLGLREETAREDTRSPQRIMDAVTRREQKYIMEVLQNLEEDWKRTMEEDNPFA